MNTISHTPHTHARTVGSLFDLPASVAAAFVGLALATIGSIGPWATVLAFSVPGTRGDGRITLALAGAAGLLLLGQRASTMVLGMLASLAITATAVYDLAHIERATNGAPLVGAGWGIYLVLAGGVAATLAFVLQYVNAPATNATSRGRTRRV